MTQPCSGALFLVTSSARKSQFEELVHREGSVLGARDRGDAPHGVKEPAKDAQGQAPVNSEIVERETGQLVLANQRDLHIQVGEIEHPAV